MNAWNRCRIGLVGACLGLLAGCQYDPNGFAYTRTKPATAAVVGVWDLDIPASDWRPGPGAAAQPHTIELELDGTAAVVGIPAIWRFGLEPQTGGFDSGAGTWKLEEHQERWDIALTLTATNGVSGSDAGHPLSLADQQPPYRIFVVLGDPDEGHKLVFRRRAEDSPGR